MDKIFFVYMTSNKWRGPIYTGMSGNMPARGEQHQKRMADGFTKKYHLTRIVYYETHPDARGAAAWERTLKRWRREWKIQLIEEKNPEWRDLYEDILKLSM